MINIIKFSALCFAANEYFAFTKDDMIKLKRQELEAKYDLESLNRSKRSRAEKEIEKTLIAYEKAMDKVRKTLETVSNPFINSKKESDRYAWDFSINLLHRTLDRFNLISDSEVVVDEFKNYIFESLDKIPPIDRSDADLLRFKAAYDNFLVTNKVVKR